VGQHLRPDSYDAIVSWLTVLHIPERAQLFKTVLFLALTHLLKLKLKFSETVQITNETL
jgi:hypothetical protein